MQLKKKKKKTTSEVESLGFHALLNLKIGMGADQLLEFPHTNNSLAQDSCADFWAKITTRISPLLSKCPSQLATESCSLLLPRFDLRNLIFFIFLCAGTVSKGEVEGASHPD